MTGLSNLPLDERGTLNEGRPDNLRRVEQKLARAEALRPDSLDIVRSSARVHLRRGRFEDAIAGYQHVISADQNATVSCSQIGVCWLELGRPDAALPFFNEAIRRDSRNPDIWLRYASSGETLLHLKRPEEAVPWLRRALDANPSRSGPSSLTGCLALVGALGHSGRMDAACRELSDVIRLAPFLTARIHEKRSQRLAPIAPLRLHVAEGLRLVGLRDPVDEDADAGVSSDSEVHQEPLGPIPISVPGAATVRTDEARRLLAEAQPLVLDLNATGRSLPGAVVFGHAFTGGTFDDALQKRLRRKVLALTGGDTARSIVVFGWNAERWGSRNLALRLVALGYTRVHWYRGGKEVWEARGLPEVEVDAQGW